MASSDTFRRHEELMRLYSSARSSSIASDASITSSRARGVSQQELQVLRDKFQFIRDDEADAEQGETDWQVRMSVRYYRQLFREYALADLSRYQEGKIGLRWRTEREVISGKGQFSCGNKRCDAREDLHSYELLFGYVEHGEKKRCLVKVRVCGECAKKLFFKKLAELKKQKKRRRRDPGEHKAKRRRTEPRSDEEQSPESSGDEIHDVCAKINAEQKAAYPSNASIKRERADVRRGEFDELLP